MTTLADLKWDANGLIPAIVQDDQTDQVLMLAWMNGDALRQTLVRGYVHFWSRSRQELWLKGATSGNVLVMTEIRYDCDGDALLVRVTAQGPACHTGETSCFYRQLEFDDLFGGVAEARAAQDARAAFEWPKEAGEGADS
jgi:phosphoribosyl-ATP pyrophosphohydrolase/phosphoribosyl-AMP cyclohydrolase